MESLTFGGLEGGGEKDAFAPIPYFSVVLLFSLDLLVAAQAVASVLVSVGLLAGGPWLSFALGDLAPMFGLLVAIFAASSFYFFFVRGIKSLQWNMLLPLAGILLAMLLFRAVYVV